MTDHRLVSVTYLGTTPERLWQALTRGEVTRSYWYDRRLESTWEVGSPVAFFDAESDVRTDGGVVLVHEPPRRLAYSFRCELTEETRAAGYSRVAFDLLPCDAMVKLTLTHDQLPDEASVAAFREGWAPILSSLKTLLETGQPMPRLRDLEEQGRPRD